MFTDDEILDSLSKGPGDPRYKKAMGQLYVDKDLRNMVFSYILNHGGHSEDALEVFQDSFLLFQKAVSENRFQKASTMRTYIVGIVKWHWFNLQRKRNQERKWKSLQKPAEIEKPDGISAYSEEEQECLDRAIALLDQDCQDLISFWSQSHSPSELAEQFGYSSPEMAKKASYRCRKKIKAFLAKDPKCAETLNR